MILSETLWPLFAAASFFREAIMPESKGNSKDKFPGHTLIKLNDVSAPIAIQPMELSSIAVG